MESKILFENDFYKFFYNHISYEINNVSPLLELKRFKLIQNIKKEINSYLSQKDLKITASHILPKWVMLQFKNKNYYIDPIFPYNGIDNSQLKDDLYYLSNKKLKKDKINKIITELNLTQKFNNAIEELRDFIKSGFYINNIDNFNIKINTDDDNFQIDIFDNIDFTYKFKINKKIIDKIEKNYILVNSTDDFLTKIISCIIIRYNTLESYNQQAAVLPELYQYLGDNYNVDCELFASAFNCFYNNYCSLYYDIELYCGSKGNFFNMDIIKGFYVANPPFDNTIMKNMALQLVNSLKKSNDELSVFITIPDWDKPEYGGFECLDILKKSGYIQYIEKIHKNRVIFFDYYNNQHKNLVGVNFILIQNKNGKKKHAIAKDLKKILLQFFPK